MDTTIEIQETHTIKLTKADIVLLLCRYKNVSADQLKSAHVSVEGTRLDFDDLEIQAVLTFTRSPEKPHCHLDDEDGRDEDGRDEEYDDHYVR